MPTKLGLEWRTQAQIDLVKIIDYIAEDSPDAALELWSEIDEKVGNLAQYPQLYKRSGRVPGMRELVVRGNYVVIYRELPQKIEIVSVLHARQQWPK